MNITVCTQEAQKGFYPTPPDLAKKLLDGIDLNYVNHILEPSAGTGNLIFAFADKVYEKYYGGSYSGRCDLNVDVCEIDPGLRGILQERFSDKAKFLADDELRAFQKANGYEAYEDPQYDVLSKKECLLRNTELHIINDDFLTYETWKKYDLIVMNPPFLNGDAHLLKAIAMQERTGGKIRCILNAETIRNPYTRRRQELVKKLGEYSAEISFETGAFSDAERNTDVDVAIVKLDIPAPNFKSDIFERCLKAEQQKQAEAQEATDIVSSDSVKQAVAYYRAEVAAGIELINQYLALLPYIKSEVKASEYDKPMIQLAVGKDSASDHPSSNAYCQAVRMKYWKALFLNPQFTQQLTKDLRNELLSRVQEMQDLEFSEFNIRVLYTELNARMATGIEDSILKIFDTLTCRHTYNDTVENGNVHYFSGWKTNKAYMVGKKVIIPWHGYVFGYSWNKQDNISAHEAAQCLCDIEKALNYLDGNMTANINLYDTLLVAEKSGQTRKIPCKFWKATFYKKGTCHLEFTCPELIDRLNIFCAQKRGWLPPSYGKKTYSEMDKEEQAVIDSFHGDDTSGSGEKAYANVMAHANYYLAKPNQNILALPSCVQD